MNKKSKRKQKKAEERRQQEITCIEAYLQELLENVNLKVICDMEEEVLLQENLLWAEEIPSPLPVLSLMPTSLP